MFLFIFPGLIRLEKISILTRSHYLNHPYEVITDLLSPTYRGFLAYVKIVPMHLPIASWLLVPSEALVVPISHYKHVTNHGVTYRCKHVRKAGGTCRLHSGRSLMRYIGICAQVSLSEPSARRVEGSPPTGFPPWPWMEAKASIGG
jgi:hypothetical protein